MRGEEKGKDRREYRDRETGENTKRRHKGEQKKNRRIKETG